MSVELAFGTVSCDAATSSSRDVNELQHMLLKVHLIIDIHVHDPVSPLHSHDILWYTISTSSFSSYLATTRIALAFVTALYTHYVPHAVYLYS